MIYIINFPQVLPITVGDYIKEINNAIDSHNYLSALALSLIIPDICSKYIEKEKNENDAKKYIKWFNKYVYSKYYSRAYEKEVIKKDDREIYEIEFNGAACYALRNAVLHSGSTRLKYIKNEDKIEAVVDSIELCVNSKKNRNMQYGDSVSITVYGDNTKSISIRINIVIFAENMISGYNNFLLDTNMKDIELFNLIDWDRIERKSDIDLDKLKL